jgi:tRNA 2-thiouridine synthesizing protein C
LQAEAMSKRLLFIQHRAPYSDDRAAEMLDALLVAAAFGQAVTVLFQDDGVWQLLPEQDGKALERKTLLAQLQALGLYDVERLYVDQQSLQERGLQNSALGLHVSRLTAAGIAPLLAEHDLVLRF